MVILETILSVIIPHHPTKANKKIIDRNSRENHVQITLIPIDFEYPIFREVIFLNIDNYSMSHEYPHLDGQQISMMSRQRIGNETIFSADIFRTPTIGFNIKSFD